MTLTTPDLLEQLGLDDEIHCDQDTEDGPCTVRASWWLICQCCNHHEALCARHRAELDTAPPLTVTAVGPVRAVFVTLISCEHCHSSAPIGKWRDLFLLVPIGDQ